MRRDTGAVLWRYRHGACILDLVLYPGDADDGLKVAFLESRDPTGAATETQPCITRIWDSAGRIARAG